ncbi:MAG: glycosyltransferase family 2 protein [Muribaculaceae bacterium]|nr:glycosyltransferase family 2 protein [Muribaculaceae bacterium]MDE6027246.1 glycosyltransferase family 2 protein [Muribaculaceae bacterium]
MITASVVLYNTPKEEINNVLGSLENSSVDLIYVIDHSADDMARPVVEQFKKVRYERHANAGYGTGHNHGIQQALASGSKYHAVINPDVFWGEDVIKSLADFMDSNPDCGLVMPRVLFPNGDIQYLCKLLPTPMDLIGRRFIPLKGYTERHNFYYEMRWSGYDKVMDIPCLSGCFMFMRCDVLRQTGGFDERFFLYAEDIDLCRRIGEKARTLYYPKVSVYHAYRRESYKSLKFLRIHINSIIKYFNKWGWFVDHERERVNRRSLRLLHKSR